MASALHPGLVHEREITVTREMMASSVGSGLVHVYATAMMIAGMEGTAVELLQPFLPEGFTTVGTQVNVSHVSATPCGMKVRFRAELTAIAGNGKGFTFRVTAHDAGGLIGEGTHERVMVNAEAFEQRIHTKAENLLHRAPSAS
ncbi:thioesterase family protein [uncultured Desulfovibrio sp.]|uniref:Thioesterase family protein n=1 Tax=Candidatus Desulfovibrio intestinavium TaxID=2838534 RepID=A0A9D2HPX9_9BACT|nr:thioesterase family protein [uncultured Desulfovibrio sp.]HJA80152.1 thioesterase family protein [Candidatus Desulfovibrio intestinavium]